MSLAEFSDLQLSRRQALLGMAVLPGLLPAVGKAKDKVDIALDRGARHIVNSQESDGTFTDPKARDSARNGYALTALGLMALASIGHQPGDPNREGIAMKRALGFMLRNDRRRNRSGGPYEYYGSDGGRMYGHGIATLCLSEMMGMGVDRDHERLLRKYTTKAVDLILVSQKARKGNPAHRGGWRYDPTSNDSDLSVTVWQLMALRSAKNAGINVPKEAIDMAVRYLKRSYFSPRDARGRPVNLNSGCGYMPNQPPRYSTTAAGLLSLQVCGEYDAPEVIGSVNWLKRKAVTKREQWFYYGTYYYAQGMQKRKGDTARNSRDITEKLLMPMQSVDGSWSGNDGMESGAGRVYCTSLAMLSLSVKYHFLPIYQH
ncbi:hypothetical protein OAK45_10000 [Verrucomicrobia bacterium]|nr:hypothetical protein [Verrucomicrobiota bacterium]